MGISLYNDSIPLRAPGGLVDKPIQSSSSHSSSREPFVVLEQDEIGVGTLREEEVASDPSLGPQEAFWGLGVIV